MGRWTVLMIGLGAFSAATATERHDYTVVTGDYSQIGGSDVGRAAKLAEQILEKAGIPARLVVCPVTRFQGVLVADCPETDQLPDAFLKIVKCNAGHASERSAMGVAMRDLNSTQPNNAYVFYEVVQQVAASGDCAPHQVLGHALAHEIGHLLGAGHSTRGIMRPDWNRSIIAEMSRGTLTFSAEQAETMRGNAEGRTGRRSPIR